MSSIAAATNEKLDVTVCTHGDIAGDFFVFFSRPVDRLGKMEMPSKRLHFKISEERTCLICGVATFRHQESRHKKIVFFPCGVRLCCDIKHCHIGCLLCLRDRVVMSQV